MFSVDYLALISATVFLFCKGGYVMTRETPNQVSYQVAANVIGTRTSLQTENEGILTAQNTVELQRLKHLWNLENVFESGVVRANACLS